MDQVRNEEIQALLDELEEEDRERAKEHEVIEGFDTRYGRLFHAIGIQLEVVDLHALKNKTRLVAQNRIVPELADPEKFVAYLGNVGIEGIYADPTHCQLADDVIEYIKKNCNHARP